MKAWESSREYSKRNVLARDGRGYAAYLEVEYKEYTSDGRVITGTEDFSSERWATCKTYWIHTPTGELNKGGHRIWRELGTIRTMSAREARMIATIKYGSNIELQIRS